MQSAGHDAQTPLAGYEPTAHEELAKPVRAKKFGKCESAAKVKVHLRIRHCMSLDACDAHVPVVWDKTYPAEHAIATVAEAHDAAPGGHEVHVPAVDLYCADVQVVAANPHGEVRSRGCARQERSTGLKLDKPEKIVGRNFQE